MIALRFAASAAVIGVFWNLEDVVPLFSPSKQLITVAGNVSYWYQAACYIYIINHGVGWMVSDVLPYAVSLTIDDENGTYRVRMPMQTNHGDDDESETSEDD